MGFASATFREGTKLIKRIVDGVKFVRHTQVIVGITEESDVEREDGMTNAQLLYLQENGVPSKNIPPRPVIQPALAQDETRKAMKQQMRQAMFDAIVKGDLKQAKNDYEKAGMIGRDACKNYITDGTHLTPNSPVTIARKGSSIPLIDTASMMNSISYAIRKK